MNTISDLYKTIDKPSKGLYKIKGSKFLSFAYPVFSDLETKPILASIKKEFFDARHHCFAYQLGLNKEVYRTFDDGEPSGTAGKPILGQINSYQLTNIFIIVVRYFGGTLLGTSGLINAYKLATIDALNNAKIIEKAVETIYEISFDYIAINEIMKILKDENISLLQQDIDNISRISIAVRNSKSEILTNKISKVKTAKLKLISPR